MLTVILVLLLALIPSLLSLWLIRQSKQRFQARMRQIRSSVVYQVIGEIESTYTTLNQQERPYFIGDISCCFNARSPYLRCAVNPDGPCEGCSFYESRTKDFNSSTF